MVISVKIPDELVAQAKARGMSPETYVQSILEQQLRQVQQVALPRSAEEIRAWLDSMAQFSDKIPPLPETITRGWIYQDEKYLEPIS